MTYITLSREVFFDQDGYVSLEYLSQYCQQPTTEKFIYGGTIYGYKFPDLIFPNIVKAEEVSTENVSYQFPDLVFAEILVYNIYDETPPDIGKLESVDYLQVNLYRNGYKYFNYIDDNNVLINGKNLAVNKKAYRFKI